MTQRGFMQRYGRIVDNDLIVQFPGNIFGYRILIANTQGPQVRKGNVLAVYVSSIAPYNQVDSTYRTDVNTATYNPPLQVPPGSDVFFVWQNGASINYSGQTTVSLTIETDY